MNIAIFFKFGSYLAEAIFKSEFFQLNVRRFVPIVYETLESFVSFVHPDSGMMKYLSSEFVIFICLVLFFTFTYRWFFVRCLFAGPQREFVLRMQKIFHYPDERLPLQSQGRITVTVGELSIIFS